VVFLSVALVYLPALGNEFVPWDDEAYLLHNLHIRALNPESLKWMFTTFFASNWYPLTWLSHAVDFVLWGENPHLHHLTAILFHAADTVLVFFVCSALVSRWRDREGGASRNIGAFPSPWIAGLVTALLFGLHPIHVESAAWISERKDLLCAFFVLSGILSYLRYTKSPGGRSRTTGYLATFFLLLFALMSKPMAVTFPVVLLLIDYDPLGRLDAGGTKRIARLFVEKIPFFLLSAVSSVMTLIAQAQEGAVSSLGQVGLSFRILNSLKSLVFYLYKLVWPFRLSPLYEFPPHSLRLHIEYLVSALLVTAVTIFCLRMWRKGRPFWITGWGYYLVTLFPVLGLIQVGRQTAADRYMYLPSIAPFLLVGLGVSWLWEKTHREQRFARFGTWVPVGVGVVLILLSALTVRQIRVWKDGESLWSHAVQSYPETAWLAYYNLSFVYADQGDFNRALVYYKKGLAINPTFTVAMNSMGKDYAEHNLPNQAVTEFQRAIAAKPDEETAYANLGHVYIQLGKIDEAVFLLKKAVAIKKDYATAYRLLGAAYTLQNRTADAVRAFRKAVRYNPKDKNAYFNLGLVYTREGRLKEGRAAYERFLRLDPSNAVVHYRLSRVCYLQKDIVAALQHATRAAALGFPVGKGYLDLLQRTR